MPFYELGLMAHLKSPIWTCFSMCDDDNSKVVRNTCSERIPRSGSSPKTFNATDLQGHLQLLVRYKLKILGLESELYFGISTALVFYI